MVQNLRNKYLLRPFRMLKVVGQVGREKRS